MHQKKTGIYAISFIVLIFGLIFFYQFVAGMSGKAITNRNSGRVNKVVQNFTFESEDFDYKIYWVGDVPEELTELSSYEVFTGKIEFVSFENASDDNLPVVWPEIASREYDENGILVKEIIPRDYPDHMVIVVNATSGFDSLSEDGLESIRNSAAENNVDLIVIGREGVDTFRDVFFLPKKNLDENTSMYFSTETGYVAEPFALEAVGDFRTNRTIETNLLCDVFDYIYGIWVTE